MSLALSASGGIHSLVDLRHNQEFKFRQDEFSGPSLTLNGQEIKLRCKDKERLLFTGSKKNIAGALRYELADEKVKLTATIQNNENRKIDKIQVGLRLGIDTYMRRYPDWNNRLFPTLLRCEKTHFWGYFMGPKGQIITVCSPDPVASWDILYKQYQHRLYTASLSLLNPGPLPSRHPGKMCSLAAGEEREWVIFLQPTKRLEDVKPISSLLTQAPMFEFDLMTRAEGESFSGRVLSFVSGLKELYAITPDKKKERVRYVNLEPGIATFNYCPQSGPGIYTFIAMTENGKLSTAKTAIRHPWSWHMKQARQNAIAREQKASTHVESWYGLFSAFLARKHFPEAILDKQAEEKYQEIWPLMYDLKTRLPLSRNRIQNHALAASLLSARYQVTGDIKDLEFAASLVDFLLSKQSKDGAYRNEHIHYTSVIYIAKAIMEVVEQEEKLVADNNKWRERYKRHLDSVKQAVDNLAIQRDNIDTEGELTYEDGMISCSYSQLAMYALYYASPEERKKYLDAALYLVNGHRCLSQLLIPDCRMHGGSLRFWESQYDILTKPNMMNSPHGWSAWRIYGLWYLYQLIGEEKYLKQVYNALGACCQLIDFKSGELRWAFVPDPYIRAAVWVEDPNIPGKGQEKNQVIGEQYMPMISGWYKAPVNKRVTGYGGNNDGGCCDNDVHEIFKCLEETALTSAYVIEKRDAAFSTYNCRVSARKALLMVTPSEAIVNSVHFNLNNSYNATINFAGEDAQKISLKPGMVWVKKT